MKVSYLKSFARVETDHSGPRFTVGVVDRRGQALLLDEVAGQPREPFMRVANVRGLLSDLRSIAPEHARIYETITVIKGAHRAQAAGSERQTISIEGRPGRRVARLVSRLYHIPLLRS